MGIFGGRRQRGMTPAEEAARRRQAHVPEPLDREPVRGGGREVAAPMYETKVLEFAQVGMMGRTDVEAKLAPFVADGWEVVSDDRKRYGVGGKHSVLLRRRKL